MFIDFLWMMATLAFWFGLFPILYGLAALGLEYIFTH
jgi:hypothetical protein